MARASKTEDVGFLIMVGLAGWVIPGAGHMMIGQKKHAIIICVTICVTFAIGLYVGSIGVVDSVSSWPWYIAQSMNSPVVMIINHATRTGAYPVYGKALEIGQIYTSIAGLLNLLCIINAVYLAYILKQGQD